MSRQQLQLTLACQARLLDTPFPPFSSHLPPQSSSFGSTDAIRTQVSVGPEREGMAALLPWGTLECSCHTSCFGSRASAPMPQGTLQSHPALPQDPGVQIPGCPTPRSFSSCSWAFPTPMKCMDPDPVSLEKTGIPHPTLGTHTNLRMWLSASFSPRTRSAGPTPVPVKPQESVILSYHTPR